MRFNNKNNSNNECTILVDDHLKYLQQRRQKEAQDKKQQSQQLPLKQQRGDGTTSTPDTTISSSATARSTQTSAANTGIIPRRFDVLLGRGKTTCVHTGNLRLFHIVEMNRSQYESSSRYDKTRISEDILQMIHHSYGRFLKKQRITVSRDGGSDNGGDDSNATNTTSFKKKTKKNEYVWIEATHEEAREKIIHCFRRLRELDNQQQQEGNQN